MAVVKIENPYSKEIEQVEIAGEEPTQEELGQLANYFAQQAGVSTNQTEIDMATASADEIAAYAAAKEAAGIDPKTGAPLSPADRTLMDPNVDYFTGLKDFELRAGLGARETQEEKIAYLTDKIGAQSFRQDEGGRFILTQGGRQKLGLGEGKELAIDEEGLSRYDVADFAGASGVPLAAGIGAGILLSGTGFLLAAPAVGVTMGLAKLADEAYETSLGYQRQSRDEILRDAAYEGVFGATGEVLGRGISSIFGRILKGSGSAEAEAARAQGRELIKQKFRPTVEGAAPGVRPVLNRLQAIYEGVFPNQKAADENLRLIKAELKAMGTVDDVALDNLERVVKQDIQNMFTTSGQSVQAAQRALDTEIEEGIKAIIEPLRRGEKLSKESIQSLVNSKTVFDEQADGLFTAASRALGENNRIIPVSGIKKVLDRISRTSPEADQLNNTQLYRIVEESISKVVSEAAKRGESMSRQQALAFAYISPEDAHIVRQIVRNLGYSDEFKATVAGGNQAALKASVDDAFFAGEQNLNLVLAHFGKSHPKSVTGRELTGQLSETEAQKLRTLLNQSGMEFTSTPTTGTLTQLREGLNLMQRSRKYYERGMRRFGDPVVEKLYKETQAGRIDIDATKFMDELIEANSPEKLRRYFRAIRGTPLVEGLEAGEATLARASIPGPGGRKMSLSEAKAYRDSLPDNNTKREISKRIQQAEDKAAKTAEARGQGAAAQEASRQQLARSWLERELADPTNKTVKNGVEVIDGIKLAQRIEGLGSTAKVLFKGEVSEMNRLTQLLKQTGTEFDPAVLNQFADDSIANTIRGVNEALATRAGFNENSFLQALSKNDSEGIVSAIFQRGNAEKIRQFKSGRIKIRAAGADGQPVLASQFGEISEQSVAAVEQAAMGRILRSLGDVDSPAFREAFVSGRLGSKLQSTLEGYGRESMEAMFGKQVSNDLFKLADNMVAVSNAPIAGKGGLAAPQIAIGLGIYGMLTAPLATLPAAAFYLAMSNALRRPAVLKVLLASRQPGADKIGQALQIIQTSGQQALQTLGRSDEGPTKMPPEVKELANTAVSQAAPIAQTVAQTVTSQVPNVQAATSGTAAQVSPLLLPDPATQALAQQLGRTTP
jgi:hypothetical protein|tara:strand:+ start:2260 stop:5616 length:3357 start_codon:yes stop_codon:yes gene_type:complete